MKKPVYVCALLVAASFLLSTPASAGVLYDNGLVNASIGATDYWGIYYGYVVSDSFTLAGTSTLTGVNLDISIASGDIPHYLYWRISDTFLDTYGGTQAFLADVTNVCIGCMLINNSPGDTYFASFSLPDVAVGPGTHFLTLDWSDYLYWDVSNGPSAAYQNGLDLKDYLTPGSHSNSFQILGDGPAPTGVPEPASIAMLLSGLALVAGLARRKMRA
jgi:predicted small secreted protein